MFIYLYTGKNLYTHFSLCIQYSLHSTWKTKTNGNVNLKISLRKFGRLFQILYIKYDSKV